MPDTRRPRRTPGRGSRPASAIGCTARRRPEPLQGVQPGRRRPRPRRQPAGSRGSRTGSRRKGPKKNPNSTLAQSVSRTRRTGRSPCTRAPPRRSRPAARARAPRRGPDDQVRRPASPRRDADGLAIACQPTSRRARCPGRGRPVRRRTSAPGSPAYRRYRPPRSSHVGLRGQEDRPPPRAPPRRPCRAIPPIGRTRPSGEVRPSPRSSARGDVFGGEQVVEPERPHQSGRRPADALALELHVEGECVDHRDADERLVVPGRRRPCQPSSCVCPSTSNLNPIGWSTGMSSISAEACVGVHRLAVDRRIRSPGNSLPSAGQSPTVSDQRAGAVVFRIADRAQGDRRGLDLALIHLGDTR